MLYRMFAALSVFFLSITSVWAEVKIDKDNRITNRGYGVCAWASIETSGLQFGVKEVAGLTEKRDTQSREKVRKLRPVQTRRGISWETIEVERRDNGGTTARIEEELNARGISYTLQAEATWDPNDDNSYDHRILYNGTKNGAPGVIVGIYNYEHCSTDNIVDDCYLYVPKKHADRYGYHAVLVVDINDKYVTFIDSNYTARPWRMSRTYFDENWDGFGLVLNVSTANNIATKSPTRPTSRPTDKNSSWVDSLMQAGYSEAEARRLIEILSNPVPRKE